MKEDLISVIIPVYNTEKYLERCINSVINQTYKNIEIILIDDGSTDNSGKICDEYAKKFQEIVIIHQRNQGASVARNNGISKASGQYITFVDSDDMIEKNYVEYLYNLIKKYNVKMSIASYKTIFENGKYIDLGKKYSEKLMTTEEALDRLLKEQGFTVSPCSKMYHKSIFENIKFPAGKLFEDNGTIYKFIMECQTIAYGNETYYFYCIRSDSSTTSKFNIKKLDLIELTDNMCDDIEKEYPNLKETVEKKKITVRFSILRMIDLKETDTEVNAKRKEIENYIKKRRKYILKSKNMDKRDKMALISLMIGRRFFYLAWNIYCKIKH